MAVIPQNFIRLTNDILLIVENTNQYQTLDFINNPEIEGFGNNPSEYRNIQWIPNFNENEPDYRMLLTDFKFIGHNGVLNSIFSEADTIIPEDKISVLQDVEVAKVTILLRQNMQMFTDNSFGINLQLLNRFEPFQQISGKVATNNIISQLFPFSDFQPISETLQIDSSFWNKATTFYVPWEFFRIPEKTMFNVETVNADDFLTVSGLDQFLVLSTYKPIINSRFEQFMEFFSKQDASAPDINSTISYDVSSGLFGFSLQNSDVTKTVEQSLLEYFSLKSSDINTQINVEYNIIFGEIPLQNEDNLSEINVQDILYAKNYKVSNVGNPLLTTWIGLPLNKITDFSPVENLRYFMIYVQCEISVGTRKFSRTNQIIFDFHNINLSNQQIVNRVLENQNDPINVEIKNNYEITQNIIENKTQIETISVRQPVIVEMIQNKTFEYGVNKILSFSELNKIAQQSSFFKIVMEIHKYNNKDIPVSSVIFNAKQDVNNDWYFEMNQNSEMTKENDETWKFIISTETNEAVFIAMKGIVTASNANKS